MSVVLSASAIRDLERLQSFLAKANPEVSYLARTTILNAVQSLAVFPDRGRPSPLTGARELIVPFGQAAYVIRYARAADRGDVIILRIWHSRESRE